MKETYEKALRNKVRFDYKGTISAEDTWDLPLEDLDEIYKKLSSEKRELSEDSLLGAKTKENSELNLKIKLIKHVVQTKLKEKETAKLSVERKEKKQKILEILAKKQDNALEDKSEDELKEMLESL